MTKESAKNIQKTNVKEGCVDYRKYIFARVVMLDDGLAARGMTWPLFTVIMLTVASETCSITSAFYSTEASDSLDNVRNFLISNSITLSLLNQYVNRKCIARLHAFFDTSMQTIETEFPEEKAILEKAREAALSQMNMYIKLFICNAVAMVFAQPLGQLLTGHSWKKLPIEWAFSPSSDEFSFWLVALFQFTGMGIAHCVAIMAMSFTSLTIQMNALFDVLIFSIKNIEKRAAMRCQKTGSNYDQSLLSCLTDNVAFYQQLVRELSSATPYFRNTFFIITAMMPVVMACEAYLMLKGNINTGERVKSFLFLSIQLLCCAQTCFKLETMTDRHHAVFHAVYDSPWYTCDLKYRKLVFNTLIFTTAPKYIRSILSNEVTATMATFYTFVVSSFNILNMIQKIG